MTCQEWLEQQAKSYRSDACLIWPFATNGVNGYGHVSYNGRYIGAHRAMAFICLGEPPTRRHHAAHGCGVRACVNPSHLRWATIRDNFSDKARHGTLLRGEKHPRSVLTENQVREIRSLAATVTHVDMAKRFGVSRPTISLICEGKTWTITEPEGKSA